MLRKVPIIATGHRLWDSNPALRGLQNMADFVDLPSQYLRGLDFKEFFPKFIMNRDEAEAALLQEQTYTNKESFESASEYDLSTKKPQSWSRAWLLVHLGAFALYTTVFLASLTYVLSARTKTPLSREDLRNTPMRDAFRYQSRTVGYNFEDINPFKGQAVAEIDKLWDYTLNGRKSLSCTLLGMMLTRASAHELRLSGEEMSMSNLTSIKLADAEDEYLVQPIVSDPSPLACSVLTVTGLSHAPLPLHALSVRASGVLRRRRIRTRVGPDPHRSLRRQPQTSMSLPLPQQ